MTALAYSIKEIEAHHGLTVDQDLDTAQLRSLLTEAIEENGADPARSQAHLHARLLATGENVFCRGHLRGSLTLQCQRCLEPAIAPVDADLNLTFVPTNSRLASLADQFAMPGQRHGKPAHGKPGHDDKAGAKGHGKPEPKLPRHSKDLPPGPPRGGDQGILARRQNASPTGTARPVGDKGQGPRSGGPAKGRDQRAGGPPDQRNQHSASGGSGPRKGPADGPARATVPRSVAAPSVAIADPADPDDLDYAHHDREVVDLSGIVREYLLLSIPITALCREDCQGLCPSCGVDMNKTPCDCERQVTLSPFAALKNLDLDPSPRR